MDHLPTSRPSVAIYARVAQPDSDRLRAQTAALRAHAVSRGWSVDAAFAETGPWGISDDMLEALTGYDIVLLSEFSRLTRIAARGSEILRRLKEAGARLVIATDGGPVDETRRHEGGERPLEMLLGVMAEIGEEAHVHRLEAGQAPARARRGEQR